MKYFSLEELLTSSTARQKSIENLPSWEIVENLKELAKFLDDAREEWGSGIRVSSGYRCPKLNEAVSGVPNSCHQLGWAADLQPINGDFEGFKKFITEWAKDKLFDQIIIERSKKTEWIHISLFNGKGQQRRRIFNMEVK